MNRLHGGAPGIDVLDHGHIELLDYMGNDKRIVDAARVSIAGKGVRAVQEDRGLIRYLLRNRHTTPFEMVTFTFGVKAPIFVARQWVRHRMSSTNEMSARYSELPEEFYVPEVKDIQLQATANKQGRSGEVAESAETIQYDCRVKGQSAFSLYRTHLQDGVARELARINLPLSTYTQWFWKIDLHNLFHFLRLRLDAHAQYEIRVYAEAMAELIKPIVPLAWEAFEDFQLHAMTFSRQEVAILVRFVEWVQAESPSTFESLAGEEPNGAWPTKREGEEFAAKLDKLVERAR